MSLPAYKMFAAKEAQAIAVKAMIAPILNSAFITVIKPIEAKIDNKVVTIMDGVLILKKTTQIAEAIAIAIIVAINVLDKARY